MTPHRFSRFLFVLAVAVSTAAHVLAAEPDPRDWTYWRGPEMNGASRETGLPAGYDPDGGPGGNVVWKRDDLGSRSTPIVMNGRLYTLCRDRPGTSEEGEKVVCVDAATGQTQWEHRFNVYTSDVPKERVAWSSVVGDPETGCVYANGVCGHFVCLDAATGERIWYVPLHEQFGALSTYGGRTNFPIVFEDLVITSAIVIGWGEMAKPAHRFIAMDKRTGEVVWIQSTTLLPDDTTYSAPSIKLLGDRLALVESCGDGDVWAFQPRTGVPLWQYHFSRRGINVAPLIVEDTVYAGHSEENFRGTLMGALAAIDGTKSGDLTDKAEKWIIPQLMAGKASPTVVGGDKLVVVDDRAKLYVVHRDTGEMIVDRFPLGTAQRASPLYADGKIYIITADGRSYVLSIDEKTGKVAYLMRSRLERGETADGSAIASHGRVYIPTSLRLICIADPEAESGFTGLPERRQEPPVGESPGVAHVQLVPAEALIKPGEKVAFEVRLFNNRGQRVEPPASAQPVFTVEGKGEIDGEGTFVAAADAAHQAAYVRAAVGDVAGTARVRIAPDLPWKWDFENIPINEEQGYGEPPITFVGVRYRNQVRQLDGNKALVKITDIPKGARSRGWLGHSDLRDYTIQADFMAEKTESGDLPDMGLIGQRYVIDLLGAKQQLQIRTWAAELRIAREIDYPWQAGTWHTVKMRCENHENKAVLKGKVWPRDKPEPQHWMLTAEDAAPNREGAPGLFGNARNAEIFIDNLSVTANE